MYINYFVIIKLFIELPLNFTENLDLLDNLFL
jgi:hypothetical protein